MKTVRILSKVMITIVLITCLTIRLIGQSNESLKAQEDNQISQEDLKSVLEILGIEIFNFKVGFHPEQKCKVVLYQQEFEKRNKIKDFTIWGSQTPYRTVEDGKEIYKPLKQIKIVTKNNSPEYRLDIVMGDFRYAGNPAKMDTLYKNPHGFKPFILPDNYEIGDTIPLLLFGSYWDAVSPDGKMKFQRFCMEKELNPDLTNKAFDYMPHYFIIGIRVEGDN